MTWKWNGGMDIICFALTVLVCWIIALFDTLWLVALAGGVKSIRIPKDKTGKGKGFAYIEFKDRISHGVSTA